MYLLSGDHVAKPCCAGSNVSCRTGNKSCPASLTDRKITTVNKVNFFIMQCLNEYSCYVVIALRSKTPATIPNTRICMLTSIHHQILLSPGVLTSPSFPEKTIHARLPLLIAQHSYRKINTPPGIVPAAIIAIQVITIQGESGIICDISRELFTRGIATGMMPAIARNVTTTTCGKRCKRNLKKFFFPVNARRGE